MVYKVLKPAEQHKKLLVGGKKIVQKIQLSKRPTFLYFWESLAKRQKGADTSQFKLQKMVSDYIG